MHIIIVDDEPLARMRLKRLLDAQPRVTKIDEAANADQALKLTLETDPDILLMDIRMPGTDGLTMAKQISNLDDPPAIIFCTAYDAYALEAFETVAAGYILKPVSEEKLGAAIEKAARLTKVQRQAIDPHARTTGRKHITAQTHKGIEMIPLEAIICFIADNKYVSVIHDKGEHILDDTLKELEAEFEEGFIRVHRKTLVKVNAITGLEKDEQGVFYLTLKNSHHKPQVSRRHQAKIKTLIQSL